MHASAAASARGRKPNAIGVTASATPSSAAVRSQIHRQVSGESRFIAGDDAIAAPLAFLTYGRCLRGDTRTRAALPPLGPRPPGRRSVEGRGVDGEAGGGRREDR